MKSNLKNRIIALVLCMALVLSGSIRTLFVGDFQADEVSTEEAVTTPEPTTEEVQTSSATTSSNQSEVTTSSVPTPVATSSVVTTPVAEPQAVTPTPVLELTYEDEDLKVTANAQTAGIIPEGAALKVVPILSNVLETQEQYKAVKEQLDRRAVNETYDIAGFLAYDICFVDAAGNKVEPYGDVWITMEHKKEAIPEGVSVNDQPAETVMHLMQDAPRTGEITQDLITDETDVNRKAGMEITAEAKVKKTVFVTNYFYGLTTEGTSYFTEVWMKAKPVATPEPTVEPTAEPTPEVTAEPTVEVTPTEKPEAEPTPAATLNYEDKDVEVVVTADKEGVIPEGSTLKVVPILPDKKATKDQYEEVKDQLEKKAEDEEYDIAGFLAYDITFVDEDGNKVEPNGDVKVSMEYKEEVIPEEITKAKEDKENLDVTVMHLEENTKGDVKKVVDMVADETKEAAVETTEKVEVKKAEFVTDSFSVYTITWTRNYGNERTVKLHYVDTSGKDINGYSTNAGDPDILNGNQIIDLTDDDYLAIIPGYAHKITTVDNYNNTIEVNSIIRYKNDFYYNSYNNEWNGNNNNTFDVYFVYEVTSGGSSSTEKGLTSDKNVSVVDENTRKYEIDLSAKATGREAGTAAKGASIVLVLDESASMNQDGKSLQDIKDAAKAFVTTAKEKSNISEIAVVWYNGTEGSDTMGSNTEAQGFKQLNTTDNVNAINTFINGGSASGGTPMGDALHKANDLLTGAKNANKYVLFFTDGMPGHNATNAGLNCKVANNAINYANTIKNTQKAEIYTIGYGLSGSFTWTEGHSASSTSGHGNHNTTTTAENFLKNYIASDANHAYTTTDSTGLTNIFTGIAGQLGDPYVINADSIVDVIDSRFELTAESESALRETFGSGLSIVKNNDGTTTLTWTGDAAKILNELDGGWSASFQIQAKADFVGGNVVPTNGSSSGINYKDGTTAKDQKFPQPSINVKLLTPEVGDGSSTYKQGDTIQSPTFPGMLTPTFDVVELDNTTKLSYELLGITDFTAEELATLNRGEVVNKDYKYPGTNDVVGHFSFSYAPSSETPAANTAEHTATIIGNRAEVYELTATFVPNTVESRKSHLTDIEAPNTDSSVGGTPVGEVEATGEYVVNITDPTGGTENKKLESDKQATAENEDDRLFKIDLTAHTTGREEGTEAKGASIVLVLDASNSMTQNGKKLQDVKDAANAFVASAAQDSAISEIAIVWYKGHEGGSSQTITSTDRFYVLNTETNIRNVNTAISNGTTSSNAPGTPMGAGLTEAYSLLNSKASNSDKYVLLFTDGIPGYSSNDSAFNCMASNNAVVQATNIKNSGAKLYTVGYKLDETKVEWNSNHSTTDEDHGTGWFGNSPHNVNSVTGAEFLSNYIATNDTYAFTTDDALDLSTIFEALAGQMGNPYSIQPEKIVDVIDARFELTADSEKVLKDRYGNDLSIVKNDDGTTTLTWTGESAKIKNAIDGGWEVSFDVQAKADFVGGNGVPTNGPSSGIYVEGSTPKYFPQPSVNVKLLTPEVGDNEVTLYKGDLIESSGFVGELADTFKVTELDNTTKLSYADLGLTELTVAELASLNAGTTVNRDYSYPGTTDVVGHFEFSYAPTATPGGNVADHDAEVIGSRVEVYELTVKYIPNTVDQRHQQLPNVNVPDSNDGTPVTELSDKGEYVVNVLDRWFVVKQSSSTDADGNHPLIADAEFKMSPETTVAGKEQATYYGKTDATGVLQWYSDEAYTTSIALADIKYDTYILEEIKAPTGYTLSLEKWKVEITETGTTITSNGIAVEAGSISTDTATGTAYYFDNVPIYSLPSTGGIGIYWYSIGGVLLMLAAALILYRKRLYKEVLKR